jgi:hypothetical protein
MTDRAVQPEAPTTEAGRRLLDQWNPGHVNPRLVQTVLAIEADAYRQGWDANTATSFGNRAASQERYNMDFETPDEVTASQERPPDRDPIHAHHDDDDERPEVAQERPPIDVDEARRLLDEASTLPWSIEWPQKERATLAYIIRERETGPQIGNVLLEEDARLIVYAVNFLARLAGGSVASPESSE